MTKYERVAIRAIAMLFPVTVLFLLVGVVFIEMYQNYDVFKVGLAIGGLALAIAAVHVSIDMWSQR